MNTSHTSETWRPATALSMQELEEEIKRIEIENSRREIMKSNPHINWHISASVH